MNTLPLDMHPYFAEIGELRVSSHLLVARDGGLTQFVKFTDRAWHAGQSSYNGRSACNDFSIGVELEGVDYAGLRRRPIRHAREGRRPLSVMHTLDFCRSAGRT